MPSARGCDECRSARVKCDGERPVCARCRRLRLVCAGYRDANALVIRNENAIAERNSMKRRQQGSPVTASPERPTTRNLQRFLVRYIPPQRRLERDRLPWLGAVLPPEIQPDATDLAVSRFLAHYVLSPSSHMGDDGYMADLPHFYAQCRDESALRLAINSCALMSYSAATQSPTIRLDAQKTYVEALSALRKATTGSVSAVEDETLMALLILDHYSLLGDENGSFLGPHAQGIAPILRLRGAQQLRSMVGWNLFRIAHRRMQIRKMVLKEAPMLESFEWISSLDPSHVEARIASNALQIIEACVNTRKLIDDNTAGLDGNMRTVAVQQAVPRLLALESTTSVWPATAPASWRPRTLESGSEFHAGTSSKAARVPLLYPDFWVATTFNWHRIIQLHLHETLNECWHFLGLLDTTDLSMEYSQHAATMLIDDTLASVPFIIGKIDSYGNEGTQTTMKEVGVYMAIVALQMIVASPLASIAQTHEARSVLDETISLYRHGVL